jgi:hypothetical protein
MYSIGLFFLVGVDGIWKGNVAIDLGIAMRRLFGKLVAVLWTQMQPADLVEFCWSLA